MHHSFHFISGLPRSRSTLLSAILRQNPSFHAGVTSPVAALVSTLLPKLGGASEFAPFFDDEKRSELLKSLFNAYYHKLPSEKIIFDTNRTWTARIALLLELYPEARFICMVRDVARVIDSVENLLRSNPLQVSRALKFSTGASIYSRAEILMNSEAGLIGVAWSSLREAWFSQFAKNLIVINYDDFTRDPSFTISKLYNALNFPHFQHDFNNLVFDEPDYDATLGMPGLHKVRAKVEFSERPFAIPPDVVAKYADANFWMRPQMNTGGALIL